MFRNRLRRMQKHWGKWARRHRPLVGAAVAVLVVAVLALTFSTVLDALS